MAFFSVVVPVYNVAVYLDRFMNSILAQTNKDFELIFVDDGSKDESGALCDRYAEQYGFIRVVHKENGGLSSARNAGMDVAGGQYILWLDPDDWVEPSLLSRLYDSLSGTHADFAKFSYFRYEEQDFPANETLETGVYQGREAIARLRHQVIYGTGYILSAWTHCFRLEFLVKHNLRFVSEKLVAAEDVLFDLEVLFQAESAVVLDDCLYHYFCRPGSLTQVFQYDIPKRYTTLFANLCAYLRSNNLDKQYLADACWFYAWKLIHNRCVPMEYKRLEEGGRSNLRQILAFPELKKAILKCNLSGRSIGEKIQIFAMYAGWEPVLYYIFVRRRNVKGKL